MTVSSLHMGLIFLFLSGDHFLLLPFIENLLQTCTLPAPSRPLKEFWWMMKAVDYTKFSNPLFAPVFVFVVYFQFNLV